MFDVDTRNKITVNLYIFVYLVLSLATGYKSYNSSNNLANL